jgi:hypothetical protein
VYGVVVGQVLAAARTFNFKLIEKQRRQTMRFNPFKKKKKNNNLIWKIVGGVVLTAATAGLVKVFPDIKRYIHISSM